MLHEVDVLEAKRIAELAADVRAVRDRLLQKVRETELGEPKPARGEHNPASALVLDDLLAVEPAFLRLREAIAALPREIREKLWLLMEIGRGNGTLQDWTAAHEKIAAAADAEIVADLMSEPDLHACLRKALYQVSQVPKHASTIPHP
jgi:Protein of unknown function (DUF3775)